MWTQNTRIIHDVWRLLILSNEEKTNDYENFEKGMIYMKILKKGGVVEKRGRRKRNICPMRLWFEFQSVRRSFPRNLTENSEAASFLDQTTSFETEVQEREPWDFYEWITCNEKPRCAPNIFPIIFWREI